MKKRDFKNNDLVKVDFIKNDSLKKLDVIEKTNKRTYNGLDSKLMNLLSIYVLTLNDNKELLEYFDNILKVNNIKNTKDFEMNFNYINELKCRDVILNGNIKIINYKDDTIVSFIKRLKESSILVVCNLLDKENLFYFDNCGENKGKILISNYESSERELDELRLRPYEAIVYEL